MYRMRIFELISLNLDDFNPRSEQMFNAFVSHSHIEKSAFNSNDLLLFERRDERLYIG